MNKTMQWATPMLAAALWLAGPNDALAHKIVVRPYIQALTPTSAWILWETDFGEESLVEWGTSAKLGTTTLGSAQVSRGDARVHEVELPKLAPETRYYYRVTTGKHTSEVHDFLTPPPAEAEQPLRIVAMSDMQQDAENPTVFSDIINEGVIPYMTDGGTKDLAESLSMVLIPGDLVPDGQIHDDWRDKFFEPAAPLMATVPIYPVLGNHERNDPLFGAYFHLPEGPVAPGTWSWWYSDYGNVRIIGLNSTASLLLGTQLEFVETLLADACDREAIDFLFVQLHHPHLSELWPTGESGLFTGILVPMLDTFSMDCGKPTVHFYGHTHGYARGQSRDHDHLWIDVATAGGNIDYWGEYDDQVDYEDISVSEDEYGFVVIEVDAGDEPEFRITRINRGDQDRPHDNEITDQITVRRYNEVPAQPIAIRPIGPVAAECTLLESSTFSDGNADPHMASHWQVSASCDDFSAPVVDNVVHSENRFNEVDLQAGVDLERFETPGLEDTGAYCWRVRYRDFSLGWSEWSQPQAFEFTVGGLPSEQGCGGPIEGGTSSGGSTSPATTTGSVPAGTTATTTGTTSAAATEGSGSDQPESGCGCTQDSSGSAGWLALLLALPALRRRR